jgi:DNA primase large subunit
LYDQPPNEDIKLEEFEKYALDRVRLLTAIENALSSGKKPEELQELIKEKTKSLKLEPKSIADEVSHYALRLAFCRTESLRRQFLTSEVQLFKARFREMKGADKAKFIEHELDYNSMDSKEFEKLKDELMDVLCQARSTGPRGKDREQWMMSEHKRSKYYKVKFENVYQLVKMRDVLVKKGFAYVHESAVDAIVMTEFRAKLSKNLGLAAKRWNAFVESDERARLVPVINSLRTKELGRSDYGSDNANGGPSGTGIVLNKDLQRLAEESFPLCAKNLFKAVKVEHHLRHEGRRQLQLYLKGIGLPLEEALVFFKTEFTKKPGCNNEKFEKDYAYGVRHSYGKEGKRVDYTPHSCMKCIAANPSKGEYHGCPFKTFSEEALGAALSQMKIEPSKVTDIVKKAKNKHYQLACSDVFEAVHGGEFIEGGLHHPNQYYEQSRKVLNPKTNEDSDGKEKQAVPTPPQQKEEQTAAAAPKVVAA